jgi:hypothetical protein
MWRSAQKVAEEEARGGAIVERARQLFIESAARHGLSIEWDETSPAELACSFREQQGLDWDLWLCVQNYDELHIQHDLFTFSWFPADEQKKEAEFTNALEGLISGAFRLKCSYSRRGRRPYSVDLERDAGDQWENVYGYGRGLHFGRAAKVEIVRNGHPTITL